MRWKQRPQLPSLIYKEKNMQYLDLHENKKHGTTDFPFEYHHIDRHHPRYVMDYHWHEEYELIRALRGTLNMKINEDAYELRPGELILIPGGALHSGEPDNCIYECLVFDLTVFVNETGIISDWFRRIVSRSFCPEIFYDTEKKEIIKAAGMVFDAMAGEGTGYKLAAAGGISMLFGTIISSGLYQSGKAVPTRESRRIRLIKKVLDYIDSNYSSELTLEQLSEVAVMNPKYFCRFFRKITNRTPMDYLNYKRIEHACYELSHTGCSVTEVAYRCGFNDLSYFIRIFRKYKGVTPGKYRE